MKQPECYLVLIYYLHVRKKLHYKTYCTTDKSRSSLFYCCNNGPIYHILICLRTFGNFFFAIILLSLLKSKTSLSYRNLNSRFSGKSLKESMATTTCILTLPSFRMTTSGSFHGTGCVSVSWAFVYHLHPRRHQSTALPLHASYFSLLKCLLMSFIAYCALCCVLWHHSKHTTCGIMDSNS